MDNERRDEMSMYDFGRELSQVYSGKCDCCGKTTEISTQKDKSPETYTEVFVKCDCGWSVWFVLPVN